MNKIDSKYSFNNKFKYFIKNIKISQFRNYDHIILNLDAETIVLYGANGIGKTNILEAISFLGPGRGLRKAKSKDIFSSNISQFGQNNMSWGINADVVTPDGIYNIGSGSSKNKNSRIVKIDSVEKNQLDLSNIFKVSWVTPQMLLLFHTTMKEKRQFVDRLVNYLNPSHISYLYKFEKLIRERSKIMNEYAYEELWIDSLEKNIVNFAVLITKNRQFLISEINKINNKKIDTLKEDHFPRVKLRLDGETEEWFLEYGEEECKNKLIKVLKENRKKNDCFFPGPHKSKVILTNIKSKKEIRFCSTGEQKIMLISLILNHSKILDSLLKSPPILLLDDIVEHLDSLHKQALFEEMSKHKSQCWFTATNLEFFQTFPTPYKAISVDDLKSSQKYNKELIYA